MRDIKNVNYILPQSNRISYQKLPPETLKLLRLVLTDRSQEASIISMIPKEFRVVFVN